MDRFVAEGFLLDAVDALLGIDEDSINMFGSLSSNGISEADKMEILTLVEHEAEVAIDTDEVESLDTLDELAVYVASCDR